MRPCYWGQQTFRAWKHTKLIEQQEAISTLESATPFLPYTVTASITSEYV